MGTSYIIIQFLFLLAQFMAYVDLIYSSFRGSESFKVNESESLAFASKKEYQQKPKSDHNI